MKLRPDELDLLHEDAKNGNPEAELCLAFLHTTGTGVAKDLCRAADYLCRAAAHGLADAQFFAARAYERGNGVPCDLTKAAAYLEMATAQLHPFATYHQLARAYALGLGVPRDAARAADLFEAAATMGHRRAQLCCAVCYFGGIGCARDPELAYYWYRQAVAPPEEPADDETN